MGEPRYEKVLEYGNVVIIEDRAAVQRRDGLEVEVAVLQRKANKLEGLMEGVYEQVGINPSQEPEDKAKMLLRRIIAFRSTIAELEAELRRVGAELEALRERVTPTKPTQGDDVVGGGGG